MSSFSCSHLDTKKNYCLRVKKECVPGMKGCVLKGRFVFAIPEEKRKAEISSNKFPDTFANEKRRVKK